MRVRAFPFFKGVQINMRARLFGQLSLVYPELIYAAFLHCMFKCMQQENDGMM